MLIFIYILHICIYECIYQLADDYPALSMWVGSLPETAPTVAYDDDVIFLGTGTFTMPFGDCKKNASAVQNQCLLDSLLKNVANSYLMKRLGHEHGRTKDKRKKRNWDLHDFQFLEKNLSRPAYSCTRCARCARCTLRLNFCLALATKIEGEVQTRPGPFNLVPQFRSKETKFEDARKYTCFCCTSENSTWFNIRFLVDASLSGDLECAWFL